MSLSPSHQFSHLFFLQLKRVAGRAAGVKKKNCLKVINVRYTFGCHATSHAHDDLPLSLSTFLVTVFFVIMIDSVSVPECCLI